ALLAERLDPEAVDATRTIPVEVVDGLRELGIFRMKVPKEYGGLEFSQVNYNRVIMAIASYCGSTAVLVSAHQSIGLAQPLKMFGTAAQKAKYLPRISQGDLSAFALTEVDVGSDPARMTTTATTAASTCSTATSCGRPTAPSHRSWS
ncbi:MAG: acyl-CoA dehydrogenase family protein, partial [Planctomycetota bacterium]